MNAREISSSILEEGKKKEGKTVYSVDKILNKKEKQNYNSKVLWQNQKSVQNGAQHSGATVLVLAHLKEPGGGGHRGTSRCIVNFQV